MAVSKFKKYAKALSYGLVAGCLVGGPNSFFGMLIGGAVGGPVGSLIGLGFGVVSFIYMAYQGYKASIYVYERDVEGIVHTTPPPVLITLYNKIRQIFSWMSREPQPAISDAHTEPAQGVNSGRIVTKLTATVKENKEEPRVLKPKKDQIEKIYHSIIEWHQFAGNKYQNHREQYEEYKKNIQKALDLNLSNKIVERILALKDESLFMQLVPGLLGHQSSSLNNLLNTRSFFDEVECSMLVTQLMARQKTIFLSSLLGKSAEEFEIPKGMKLGPGDLYKYVQTLSKDKAYEFCVKANDSRSAVSAYLSARKSSARWGLWETNDRVALENERVFLEKHYGMQKAKTTIEKSQNVDVGEVQYRLT